MISKIFENPRSKELKMIYMLGPLTKEKIKTTISIEEVQRIILNPEADVLYGTLYFRPKELSDYLEESYRIKTEMIKSDA